MPAVDTRPLSLAWSVSSDTQPEAFETYRASLVDLYDVTGLADRGLTGFASATRVTRFGPSVVGRGHSVAQTFTRDPARIRRSGLEHISVVLNFANGSGDFDGRTIASRAGSVQFRDLARPSTSRADGIDLINMIVPRHSVPGWMLGRNFHGLTLPVDHPGGRLVASHLKTLADVAQDLTEEEGIAAVEATFVIAERFLGGRGLPTPPQSEAILRSVRRRAMHLFDNAQPDAPVSVDHVARQIGVSRSSLYRAFADMGGVVSYVRRRRLDRIYAALRGRDPSRVSLADIALAHGYSSTTVMNAAFASRFGFRADAVPPSALATERGAPMDTAAGVLNVAAHDVFLDWLRVGEAG